MRDDYEEDTFWAYHSHGRLCLTDIAVLLCGSQDALLWSHREGGE